MLKAGPINGVYYERGHGLNVTHTSSTCIYLPLPQTSLNRVQAFYYVAVLFLLPLLNITHKKFIFH